MEFYIYILHSKSSDIYYVGYTSNFETRLEQHNNSKNLTFTSKHRPWELKAVYLCGIIESEAMMIEKFIKKTKKQEVDRKNDSRWRIRWNIV